jgi:SAM-dependent methyltransferase
MHGYDASTYGERWADVYDDWYDDPDEVASTVDCLATVAGPPERASGPVLELGIGTGRIALPLAARGYDVRGVDASPAMVEVLRRKASATEIPVHLGDMADLQCPARPGEGAAPHCRGVFVAYNTFFNLADDAAQRACLRGVARVLEPGGWFLCAAFVPDLDEAPAPRGTVGVRTLTTDRVVLTADRHDLDAQTISGQFIDITTAGIALRPFHIRYVLPAQLDDMARAAGLELDARWGGWDQQPFDESSAVQVALYRRRPG